MEYVVKSKRGNPITNSLLVAGKFRKSHKHVIRDIRNMMEKRSDQNWAHLFHLSSYMDVMNRKQEMFIMSKDGFTLLAMGFTGDEALQFKLEYIEAFNRMEQYIKTQHPVIPQTFAEALRLAADQAEIINELAPKAQIYDAISSDESLTTLNDVAKTVNTGRNLLMRWLRNNNILRKNNTPYQEFIDRGYFQVKAKPMRIGENTVNYFQTFVTGKGLTWLARELTNLNLQQS